MLRHVWNCSKIKVVMNKLKKQNEDIKKLNGNMLFYAKQRGERTLKHETLIILMKKGQRI